MNAAPASMARADGRHVRVITSSSVSLARLREDLHRVVEYRDLFYTLGLHRVKVRYKQSLLGVTWAVLQPFALMLIYTIIFSLITRMPSDGLPYGLFAYSALLPWTFFSTVVTNATNALVSASNLVTKIYFPREFLPLTYVVVGLFDFLVASLVLGVLLVVYHAHVTLHALWTLPILAVLTCFVTAIGLVLSALQVQFRDVGVAVPLALQVWMFATPVIYPLSAVPPRVRPLYDLNPMVGVIENFRRVLLLGRPPDLRSLAQAVVVAAALLPLAYLFFKRLDATAADVI